MPAPMHITGDHSGGLVAAIVTKIGQLVTAPYAYDETVFFELNLVNTAYSYYAPKNGKQFVITGIVAFADKEISNASDTNIIVYEAASNTTTTVDKKLLHFGLAQNSTISITPLNILVSKGKFVNAKTDDDDIHMTIMGYYIPKLS